VTRAPEQSLDLTESLTHLGAEVLSLPTVCFGPAVDWTALDCALREVAKFDWLLFTSQNAVRFLFSRSRELGIAPEGFTSTGISVGVVGPATAKAVEHEGMRVEYIAKQHSGEGLVKELRAELQDKKVLLPRSDRADDRLVKALRNTGAFVTETVAYRTMPPAEVDPHVLAQVRGAGVDAIIFASPSAFYNLRDALQVAELARLSSRVVFAAIGPTTARALRESDVKVGIETEESTSGGLAAAIADHFRNNSQAVRRS
jgi:uroporphyrinogen-III synthase